MVDFNKLSDAELDQMLHNQELESLTDDQLDAALAAQEENQQQVADMTARKINEPTTPVVSSTEAALSGFSQGLTFNFADEITAAVNTALDDSSDPKNTFSDYAALFSKYQKESESAFKAAAEANPEAYFGGDIIGGMIAPGGAVKSLASFTLKRALATGAISTIGSMDSEGSAASDQLAVGLGASTVGFGVGKLTSKVIPKLLTNTHKLEIVNEKKINALLETVGVTGKGGFKKFDKMLNRRHIDKDQYVADILEDVSLTEKMTPDDVIDAFKTTKHRIWNEQIQPLYDVIDDAAPQGIVRSMDIIQKLQKEMQAIIPNNSKEESLRILQNLLPELNILENVETLTLSKLQAIKNGVSGSLGNGGSNPLAKDVKKAALRVMTDTADDAVEGTLGAGQRDGFRISRRKYGNVRETESFLLDSKAAYEDELQKFDKATLGLFDTLSSAATVAIKTPGKSLNILSNLLRNARPKFMPPTRLASLRKMSDALDAAPGRYNKHAVNIIAASARGIEPMLNALGAFESELELTKSPLKRDTQDLMLKIPHVLNLAKTVSEDLHKELTISLSRGDIDSVKEIVSELSLLKDAQGLVEQGLGWDGKITNKKELDAARSQIKQLSNSTFERMRLSEELELEGKVPVFNQQPVITPVQRVIQEKRTKSGIKPVKM